jgi:hypothetical protein
VPSATQWKHETLFTNFVSNRVRVMGIGQVKPTCIITSRSVSGAGLTSVMSCAAADVMNDPADWMTGSMRGASVSRLNVEPEEGNV